MSDNSTIIDFNNCEKKLKNIYNISDDKSLYILLLEKNMEGFIIPKIEYEVYYPLFNISVLSKLNLSFCRNLKIDLSLFVILNKSVDIVNPKSGFYNDICYRFTSESNTDITLSTRRKEYLDKNLTICEESCEFKHYDELNKKSICSCDIKTNLDKNISANYIDKKKLIKNFINFNNFMNIQMLKCYKLLFNFKDFLRNYANIIFIANKLLHFIVIIIFIIKDFIEFKLNIGMIIYYKLNWKKIQNILSKINKRKNVQISRQNDNNIINSTKRKFYNLKNSINKNINKNKNKFPNSRFKNNNKILYENNNKRTKNENIKNYKDENIKNYKAPIFLLLQLKKNNGLFENLDKNTYNNINQNGKLIKENKVFNKISTLRTTKSKISIMKNGSTTNSSPKKINRNHQIKNIVKSEDKFKLNFFNKLNEVQIYKQYIKITAKTSYELNELSYKDALKLDIRSYCEYFCSLIKTKHLLFFSFINYFDFNSRIIKIYLFFFNFIMNLTINSLFFTDVTMNKIYNEKGKFDFLYNLPQTVYSSLISVAIITIIKKLSLTEKNFLEFRKINGKKNITKKAEKFLKKLKIKIISFFILVLLISLIFWFYVGCFCAVYKNTQIYLIKDTLISFISSFLYPFGLYLLPGIPRRIALNRNNRACLYKFSKLL